MTSPVPVYVLAGFLGSGKTTLLRLAIDALVQSGRRPAVLINEIGDVDIDGPILEREVPRAEVLSGCVCCTGSGDVPLVIEKLCTEHNPDAILIEASGVANPLSIVDSVTDASFLRRVELVRTITVVSAPQLSATLRSHPEGKLFRLLRDQARAADTIILNKSDGVGREESNRLQLALREWNAGAAIASTEYGRGAVPLLLEAKPGRMNHRRFKPLPILFEENASCSLSPPKPKHATHSFLKAHTHYFRAPIARESFEAYLAGLPDQVYRVKGIVRFKGDDTLSLVQYCYGQSHLSAIRPRQAVQEVIVHIGEGFSEERIEEALAELENENTNWK
ncbi:CobW family GTP-binding protein [Cohnella fermenti]|uniref:GTP-binding protein n=1 Tax=Cohnella fermenti TaxID=2565925 RepID=A0A4S4BWJ6_9BACL|nr:GTP-binding protein [Cohnella fermenti]THF79451.1 GTP-binding protein [Cohnella fermenti]